jgi:hypothetical protein
VQPPSFLSILQIAPGNEFPGDVENIIIQRHDNNHYSLIYVHQPFGVGPHKSILHFDSLSLGGSTS